MPAYYNEIDPFAAAWLRNLIQAGHIAPGDVDERSIVDVRPDDLKGYTQAHFFAGIGGWSLAARLAGWPDDKPLWTGSCPCQPFSAAGKRKGTADERHLWPVFAALIRACRPAVVAGEQVASKDGLGWLDGVCADLEAADYAWWAGDYCAAGVGAPHIRQRLWWLGHALDQPRQRDAGSVSGTQAPLDGTRLAVDGRLPIGPQHAGASVDPVGLAHSDSERRRGRELGRQDAADAWLASQARDGLEHAARDGREQRRPEPSGRGVAGGCGEGDGVAHADEGQRGPRGPRPGAAGGPQPQPTGRGSVGFWSRYELVPCRDGTARRIEPGVFPLAHGVSGRVGKLRAYGNAIVPQVAAEILRAYLEG